MVSSCKVSHLFFKKCSFNKKNLHKAKTKSYSREICITWSLSMLHLSEFWWVRCLNKQQIKETKMRMGYISEKYWFYLTTTLNIQLSYKDFPIQEAFLLFFLSLISKIVKYLLRKQLFWIILMVKKWGKCHNFSFYRKIIILEDQTLSSLSSSPSLLKWFQKLKFSPKKRQFRSFSNLRVSWKPSKSEWSKNKQIKIKQRKQRRLIYRMSILNHLKKLKIKWRIKNRLLISKRIISINKNKKA